MKSHQTKQVLDMKGKSLTEGQTVAVYKTIMNATDEASVYVGKIKSIDSVSLKYPTVLVEGMVVATHHLSVKVI